MSTIVSFVRYANRWEYNSKSLCLDTITANRKQIVKSYLYYATRMFAGVKIEPSLFESD